MARVAVMLVNVWHCPDCPTVLKARTAATILASSEYHMLRDHDQVPVSWDPFIELTHWAFNVVSVEEEVGKLTAVGS